ncbi:hypothetical protein [Neptunomonas marina]|uniref:Uncharacterized protein n=1 Tax=Neptunomonas marina TaxID=1815562 RepID=A0A437QDL7_9GAMM|nr:hypothetical protein [Neptunomonas marina]RVU32601.1 hypothetical protein EOE65_02805 [Neptunomonas marina]
MKHLIQTVYSVLLCTAFAQSISAAELLVGKVCPVIYDKQALGILVFSREWYHDSRHNAAYTPRDNATGVGLEIHLFPSRQGHLQHGNFAQCDQYRVIQVRHTNARLIPPERSVQIDVPDGFLHPFYDAAPLEHGYNSHQTPIDSRDKPWQGRHSRASEVAVYDTPYISDGYGIEGQDIFVGFETCAVCTRNQRYDTILACGTWGYQRDYLGGMTGWTEPEFHPVKCSNTPSAQFQQALHESTRIDYSYWLDWRTE